MTQGSVTERVIAKTVPQARYDWVNNRLVLTWHEAEFKIEGTHSGFNNTKVLRDANANFVAAGIGRDDWVVNRTDGSSYQVASVIDATSLSLVSMFGQPGAELDFDTGDLYTLKRNRADIYYTYKYTGGWASKQDPAVWIGR